MEDRAPKRRFHVCAQVLIKSVAGAAVVAADFQCFSYFQIVGEFLFVFVCYIDNNFGLPIDGFKTGLFVLCNA